MRHTPLCAAPDARILAIGPFRLDVAIESPSEDASGAAENGAALLLHIGPGHSGTSHERDVADQSYWHMRPGVQPAP